MNFSNYYYPQDFTRVNVDRQYDLQYWMHRFNASEEKLREALSEVGPVTYNIEQYLTKQTTSH